MGSVGWQWDVDALALGLKDTRVEDHSEIKEEKVDWNDVL
jgi:hypothetical protein